MSHKLFAVAAALLFAFSARAGITVDQGSGSSSVKPWSVTLATPTGSVAGATTVVFNAVNFGNGQVSAPVATSGVRSVSGAIRFSPSINFGSGGSLGTYKLQCSDDATNPTVWTDITGATVTVTASPLVFGYTLPATAINCLWVRAVWTNILRGSWRATAVADVSDSLAGRYFLAGSMQLNYPSINLATDKSGAHAAVWYRVSGTGTSPGTFPVADGPGTAFPVQYYSPVVVDITTNDTAATVATNTQAVLAQVRPAFQSSTDGGATWIVRNGRFRATDNSASPITYGNSLFVTVKNGAAMQSANGVDWESNTAGTPNVTINAVQWIGGAINLYVAVGGTTTANSIWTSPDGITWTAQTGAVNAAMNCLCFDGTSIVVLGAGAAVGQYSTDGTTWNTSVVPSVTYYACAWNGTTFAAVAATGTTAASDVDGQGTWTTRTQITGGWASLAAQPGPNGRFVAFQGGSTTYMTSEDGATWTSRTFAGPTVPTSVAVDSMIWDVSTGKFQTGWTRAARLASTDGLAWEQSSMYDVGLTAGRIASNGAGILAVLAYSAIDLAFTGTSTAAAAVLVSQTSNGGNAPVGAGTSGFALDQIFPPATTTMTATIITQP